MGTAILLIVLAVVPCSQLCVIYKVQNTTDLLCQNVNSTGELSKDVLIISTEQHVSLTNGEDLETINEHFFNMFPKAKIIRFRNRTMRFTAPTKPPKSKHLSMRTLEITESTLLDNAYTFALHSLVELQNFILYSSVLESGKIDSRFLEANTKLRTITIKYTKFDFEDGALYTVSSLKTLNIIKCDLKKVPQLLLPKKSQLKELNLSGNKLQDVLSQFMFPESLETLNVIGNGIKAIYRDDFSELKNLKVLFLDDNLISTLKWDTFDDLKHVENLSLGNNLIKVVSERNFISMNNLKALDLSFNCIGNVRQIPWTFKVFWGLQKSDVFEGRALSDTRCDGV